MNIIFLDIDGVLNSQAMYESNTDTIINTPSGKLSQYCINNLNHITDNTNAKIVISSTWRKYDHNITDTLQQAGITGDITSQTPILSGKYYLRGNEILAWIQENTLIINKPYHEFHSFVILDDDSDMLLWHKENYFNIDYFSGLTHNHAHKIINFFNKFSERTCI